MYTLNVFVFIEILDSIAVTEPSLLELKTKVVKKIILGEISFCNLSSPALASKDL